MGTMGEAMMDEENVLGGVRSEGETWESGHSTIFT